jgi:hypothetical protein
MKTALSLAIAIAATSLALGCGKPVTANVNCNEHTKGFLCTVSTQAGGSSNYSVCWDIKVACADGQKLDANTCQDIGGEGKATTVVPNEKFTGGRCAVGKVTGITVENVKITKQ